jgi:iron complex outermembrane receptor protein
MRQTTFAFLGALTLAQPIAAQARDSLAVVPLDSIAIHVTRRDARLAHVPAAVAVIGGDELRAARPGIGLDESLGVIPGVYVSNRQNFSLGPRLSVRGLGVRTAFGVRGVRVIADGIPLTMPDGQTNLSNLDLLSAGAIEVLRGPASALWGNAAGGVLLVRTEMPETQGTTAEARAVVSDLGSGSDDITNLRRYALKASGRTDRLGWLASASRLDQRGYRAHSAAEVNLVNAVGRIDVGSDAELMLIMNAVDAPIARSPGGLPLDSARIRPDAAWPANVRTVAGEATKQGQVGLSFTGPGLEGRVDAAAWGLTRSVENPLTFGYIDLDRTAGGARLGWSSTFQVIDLSVGADVEHQRDTRREFDNDAGHPGDERRRDQIDRVTSVGPFAQLRIDVSEMVAMTGGVRHDRVRFEVDDRLLEDGRDDSGARTLASTSGFLGIAWEFQPGWAAWVNGATSFQTPTTTELINRPPVAGQPCCPGGFDNDLDPQTARGIETGLRTATENVALDVALFFMEVEDAIVPYQIAEVDGRTFFRNAAKTRHRGAEIGVTTAAAGATARLAYTWTRMTFVDDGDAALANEGNLLPGAPEHRFVLRAQRPFGPLALEVDVDRTGEYFADDGNLASNPASTVLDLRLSAALRAGANRIEPFVALMNTTDERYNGSVVVNAVGGRYYEPAPGRHVMLGLTLRTGTRR